MPIKIIGSGVYTRLQEQYEQFEAEHEVRSVHFAVSVNGPDDLYNTVLIRYDEKEPEPTQEEQELKALASLDGEKAILRGLIAQARQVEQDAAYFKLKNAKQRALHLLAYYNIGSKQADDVMMLLTEDMAHVLAWEG